MPNSSDIFKSSAYRRTARRKACRNDLFDVFFDRIEAGGNLVDNFLIVRPRIQDERGVGGVCVVPEMDGRIGLMRSFRHQFENEIWTAPGGFLGPDETPSESAARELREETGLWCSPERLVSLGTVLPDPGLIEASLALFVAPGVTSSGMVRGEPGVGRIVFHDTEALRRLVSSASDIGAATLIACYRCLAFLENDDTRVDS